jgi:hypothetical protein
MQGVPSRRPQGDGYRVREQRNAARLFRLALVHRDDLEIVGPCLFQDERF